MVSACDACNQPPYKGIKFPVTAVLCNSLPPILANGTYDFQQFRYSSFYNSGEGPLILHPEYCLHPELHFSFDTSGNIYHRTSQGQHSISVYGLDRPNLNVWRKEIYDDYLGDLKVLVRSRFKTVMPKNEAWFTEGVLRLFQKIRDRRYDEDRSFTLFTTYLFKHPTIFFISPFPVAEVRRQLHFAITAAFRTMAGLP
jgi:hypothetical protein